MGSVWFRFRQEVVRGLEKALQGFELKERPEVETMVQDPPDPKLGDLSCTVAFSLAKPLKKAPRAIAEEITALFPSKRHYVAKVEVAGAGFVNFRVDEKVFVKETLERVESTDDGYGSWHIGEGRRVIVEHTSVNPNKPWHMGHARNAVMGDCMARLMTGVGYDVQVLNYIDDLGKQVATTIWGIINKDVDAGDEKYDQFLGKLYVDVNKKLNPKVEKEIAAIIKGIEDGEEGVFERAREICTDCVKAQLITAYRLGILYDLLVYESDIVHAKLLDEAIERLKSTGIAELDDEGERAGTWVLRLGKYGMDDKVLIRSDGTAVYTAKDIAFQLWKFGLMEANMPVTEFGIRPDARHLYTTAMKGEPWEQRHAEIVVNVIGMEQKYPQQVVYHALKALGHEKEFANSHHLSYEHVTLPEGKFSGREGTWIGFDADTVLDEAVKRAREEVEKRNPDEDDLFKDQVARAVAIGAVRYALVRTFPEKQIVFRWEDVLDFDGETAPYIQYAHARACRILEKATPGLPDLTKLTEPAELTLVKTIARFPDEARRAAEEVKPHALANYAYHLASVFNDFYRDAPVLKAEEDVQDARLALVDAFRITCRNALELLGIEALRKM